MTKKEEALKKIEEAKQMLAEAEQALKDSEELKPYEWNSVNGYTVNAYGEVVRKLNAALFNFSTKTEAERFAKKLKIISVLNNLKRSLGDTTEYDGKTSFCSPEFCNYENEIKWVSNSFCSFYHGQIGFSEENIQKVVDYMNEHYPEGWA